MTLYIYFMGLGECLLQVVFETRTLLISQHIYNNNIASLY